MKPSQYSQGPTDTPPSIEMKPEEVQFAAKMIYALRQAGISIQDAAALLDPKILKVILAQAESQELIQKKRKNSRKKVQKMVDVNTHETLYKEIKQSITEKKACPYTLNELLEMKGIIVVRDISKPLILPSKMITTKDGEQYDVYIDKPETGKITILLNPEVK